VSQLIQLKAGQIDWTQFFGQGGSRWFPYGGILCGTWSENDHEVAKEAMVERRQTARIIQFTT